MVIEGWYYLHTNGDLIYKRDLPDTAADLRESDFVKMMWPFNSSKRGAAWNILVEAWASGARTERIIELADKWGCNDEDAKIYAKFVGAELFINEELWCATRKSYADLKTSCAGFGHTALEALVDLCKKLKYKPQKTWGTTFQALLN